MMMMLRITETKQVSLVEERTLKIVGMRLLTLMLKADKFVIMMTVLVVKPTFLHSGTRWWC